MLKRRAMWVRLSRIFLCSLILLTGSAKAVSTSEILNTPFYDPAALVDCSISLDYSLSGNSRVEKAFAFYIQKGLTAEQASGVVGNLYWESSVVPTKVNGGGNSITPIPNKAWGIAQWLGGRLTGLQNFAGKNNASPADLSTQLEFSWYELSNTEKSAGDDLKAQITVEGASNSVFSQYERAGDATGPDRLALSQQMFQKYGNNVSTTASATTLASSGCSSIAGPGQDTVFLDGFTVYSQFDPAWAADPYGTTNIADAGCGPSAMAMIITNLTGKTVTPNMTAAYADSQDLYVPGVGSKWTIGPVLAENWGLKATAIRASVGEITTALQAGKLVIASGQGSEPFTSGGHFLVIRAATANNMWRVGDSGHNNTSSQDWEPQQLVSNMNSGSVYAISK